LFWQGLLPLVMQLVHGAGVSGSAQVVPPPELEPEPDPDDVPDPDPDDEPDPDPESGEAPELLPEVPLETPPLDEPLASLTVEAESRAPSAEASPVLPPRRSFAPLQWDRNATIAARPRSPRCWKQASMANLLAGHSARSPRALSLGVADTLTMER
jgi:hypothetical protein